MGERKYNLYRWNIISNSKDYKTKTFKKYLDGKIDITRLHSILNAIEKDEKRINTDPSHI